MNRKNRLALLIAAPAVALCLTAAVAVASPNLYSDVANDQQVARLRVLQPEAGLYRHGDTINIGWRKTTEGATVSVSVYSATSSGLRNKKIFDLNAPASVVARWTAQGGSMSWVLPETLPAGRYVIAVKSGLDLATSQAFGVEPKPVPQAPPVIVSAPFNDAPGVVKKVEVLDAGKQGTVLIERSGVATTYDWGTGKCPSLSGGLAGALATMAAIGNVNLEPRVRTVSQDGKVLQHCIDGLMIQSGAPKALGEVTASE